jgi:hypothetical protein
MRIALLAFLAVAVLPGGALAQSDWPSTHYGLFIDCRTALANKGVEDATRAGLGPSAMAIAIDAKDATRAVVGTSVVFTGTGVFRPDALLDVRLRVGYRCEGDPSGPRVTGGSYGVVGDDGQPIAVDPSAFVRSLKYLETCREALDDKVGDQASRQGLPVADTEVRLDPASADVRTSGTNVEMTGRGEYRLGPDYNWAPMTFACRYDQKKSRIAKASYQADPRARGLELSPEKNAALQACRRAVVDAIRVDAERKGYRFTLWEDVVVWTRDAAKFTTTGPITDVHGSGEFKLDPSHRQSTPMTYSCSVDTAAGRVLSASYEAGAGSRTPSGDIASGRTGTLVCESIGNTNRTCPASIKGSVKVIRQISRTPCVNYENYIWSLSGITVWGGCRAEFEFETR